MDAPRRSRRMPSALLAALLAASAAAGSAAAAQSTAEGCTVEPRSIPDVVAAVNAGATPEADADADHHRSAATPPPASPPGSPTPVREPTGPGRPIAITLPEGESAPPEAVAAITATMQQFVACANAGDSLRLMALVTDEFLRGGFVDATLSEADVAAFVGTPQAIAPADQRVVVAVRDARLLSGGLAAALVDLATVAGPVPGEIRTDFVVFRPDPDRYRIAAYAAGLPPDAFGPGATPTP